MKYLTKEWYYIWRRGGIAKWVRLDPLADQFSESHYKEVFDEELRQYISSFEPLTVEAIKEKHDRDFETMKTNFPEADWQKYYDAILAWEIKTWHDDMEPFGEPEKQKLTDEFIDWQNSKIEICQGLPETIKTKVADIRLLALGYATQEVMDLLDGYCSEQDKIAEDLEREVKQRNRFVEAGTSVGKDMKRFRDEDPNILNCDSLDDQLRNEIFQKISWDGTTLRLQFEELALLIPDAKILESEELLIDSGWFEYELYRNGDRIQFHMLAVNFEKGGSIPIYFTVEGSDIQFSDD